MSNLASHAPAVEPSGPTAKPRPVVVAVHGVGDAEPGKIIQSLARHFVRGGGSTEPGFTAYRMRTLLIGGHAYPSATTRAAGPDLYEVNWADVRKPTNTVLGVVRHLFRLVLAMLRLSEYWHFDRMNRIKLVTLYRWSVEGLLVWGTVYTLVTRLMHGADGTAQLTAYGLGSAAGSLLLGFLFRSASRAFFVSSVVAATAIVMTTVWLLACGGTLSAVYLSTWLYGWGANLIAALLLLGFLAIIVTDKRAGCLGWQTWTRGAALYLPLMILAVAGTCLWTINPDLLGKRSAEEGVHAVDAYQVQTEHWAGSTAASADPCAGPTGDRGEKCRRYLELYRAKIAQQGQLVEMRKDQIAALRAAKFHPLSTLIATSIALMLVGLMLVFAGVHYLWRRNRNGGAVARGWFRAVLVAFPALLLVVGGLMVYEQVRVPEPWELEKIRAGDFWPSIWDGREHQGVRGFFDNFYARLTTVGLALLLPIGLVVSDILGDIVFFVQPQRATRRNDAGAVGASIRAEVGGRFRTLVEALVAREDVGRIVILAHSQGSVITADVLPDILSSHPGLEKRLRLITIGSPLHTLYCKLFGMYQKVAIPADCNWLNLHRSGDYIGGEIALDCCARDESIGPGGHTGYWDDRAVLIAVADQLTEA